jgi:hypothetical protein
MLYRQIAAICLGSWMVYSASAFWVVPLSPSGRLVPYTHQQITTAAAKLIPSLTGCDASVFSSDVSEVDFHETFHAPLPIIPVNLDLPFPNGFYDCTHHFDRQPQQSDADA